MKVVLPTLTGKGYDDLAISDGGQASEEFKRVTFGKVSASDRARVRKNLKEYCGLDTMGMVEIVRRLQAVL